SAERSYQLAVRNSRRAGRLLLSVYLTRSQYRDWKSDLHVRGGPAIHFDCPHNHFIAQLCFLQSHDANAFVVHFQQRKSLSEWAFMRRTLKSDQRLIEPI